jgi:hypothetical protein
MSSFITRFRVLSSRFSQSVTGEVSEGAFERGDPSEVARQVSCRDCTVAYAPQGHIPAFVVGIAGNPNDSEGMLRAVTARLEDAYDAMSDGEELIR